VWGGGLRLDEKVRGCAVSRFEFDVKPDEVRIKGQGAQVLLAGFLTRAKFGDAYQSETLLNRTLAEWLVAVSPPPKAERRADSRFGPEFIQGIAETIFSQSRHIGWFNWPEDEQVAYLREVVAIPHTLHDDEVQEIRDTVNDKLYWAWLTVEAADGKDPHAQP
jgi:hypothetical protein